MQRKIIAFCFALAFACALVAPSSVWALGLGKATVKSSLNQPLLAEIPILSARPRDLDNMTAKLAPAEMFERSNIKRSLFLSQLQFEIDKEASPPRVKVTSRSNISDPFVVLILELNWANGRIMREFTLMLDPPKGVPMPRVRERAPRPMSATGRISQPADQQTARGFTARPTASSGSRLGTDYGTVRSGQTLWQIANEVKGAESMTTEQLVMALYRTNPQAFSRQNINTLLAGRRLRVPTADEVNQIDAPKASAEFRDQVRAWRRGLAAAGAQGQATTTTAEAGQQASAQTRPTAAQGQAASAETPARQADSAPATRPEDTAVGPRLQVLAPNETRGDADAGALPTDVDALQSALIQARDEADRVQIEREQQAARLQAMQDRLALLERLVTLKDRELATLQQQSAQSLGLAAPQEDAAEAPPAVPGDGDAASQAPAQTTPKSAEQSAEAELVTPDPVIAPRVIDEGDDTQVDFIWNSPKVWLIAIGLMLLVFVLIWIFVRSMLSGDEEEDDTDLAAKLERLSAQAAEAERLAAEAGADTGAETDDEYDSALYSAGKGTNPFVQNQPPGGFSSSVFNNASQTTEMGTDISETEMNEVLKEVKVFLNYGRQDHAINFLVKLTENYPDEVKPRMELLRLCRDMKREDLFAEQAQALWDHLEDRTGPEWLEVLAMGRKMLPDHPLFGPANPYDATDDDDLGADSHEILTFNLPGEEREGKRDGKRHGSSKSGAVVFDNDSFDGSMLAVDSAETPEDDDHFVIESDEIAGDFGLDDLNAAETDAAGVDEASKGADSVANRLELAKSYVEMGDIDGAVDLIKDVLKRGNQAQIDEASRLLLSLDLS